MSVLTLRALEKHYGQVKAVTNVDLTLEEGELLAVLGPSGSGKSTLMRMVAGLELPTAGDILIDDRSIVGIPPKQRNTAMVFQSFALYPHMTVRDNILFPLRARKVAKSEHQVRLDKAVNTLEVADLLNRKPNQLSGGQQQRVALARALVRDPDMFIFDEPLSALDAQIRSVARAELRELHDRTRITTLYVTHDQLEAMGLADRIAVINKGVLHQVGTPYELYNEPADLFVAGFIGNPPMNLVALDEQTTAGIRPEHLSVATTEPAGDCLLKRKAVVEQVEYLGSEWLVYVQMPVIAPDTGKMRLIARLPASSQPPFAPGTDCWLTATADKASLFDTASGKRQDSLAEAIA